METIECFADETVFRNDENGYSVLVVKCGKTRVSAVGVMPPIAPGEKLKLTGEWVEHPVYGEIRADLMLESRRDVAAFVRKMAAAGAPPLSQLTDGIHLHTVEAKTREEIEDARKELARLGFLALEKMESDA